VTVERDGDLQVALTDEEIDEELRKSGARRAEAQRRSHRLPGPTRAYGFAYWSEIVDISDAQCRRVDVDAEPHALDLSILRWRANHNDADELIAIRFWRGDRWFRNSHQLGKPILDSRLFEMSKQFKSRSNCHRKGIRFTSLRAFWCLKLKIEAVSLRHGDDNGLCDHKVRLNR
jgi:hypothetical protein